MEIALKEFASLSSRAIAELCGVSNHFVDSIREALGTVPNATRTTSDGRQYPPPAAHPGQPRQNKSQQEIAQQVGCAVSYVNGIKKDKFSSEIIPPTRTDSMGRARPTSYATRKPATPEDEEAAAQNGGRSTT